MFRRNPVNQLRFKQHDVKSTLLRQAKKENNIVFGAQAIRKRLGILARQTDDFDFFSNIPRESANTAGRNLNRTFRKDLFFSKKGFNPGTWKVKHKGKDLIKGTRDDIGIADFTKTPKPVPKTFIDNEIRYRVLREELAAKRKLLSLKEFEFRREKDIEDLIRIKKFGRKFL